MWGEPEIKVDKSRLQLLSFIEAHGIVVQLPCRQHIEHLAYIGPHARDEFIHDVRWDLHLLLEDNRHDSRTNLGSIGPDEDSSHNSSGSHNGLTFGKVDQKYRSEEVSSLVHYGRWQCI